MRIAPLALTALALVTTIAATAPAAAPPDFRIVAAPAEPVPESGSTCGGVAPRLTACSASRPIVYRGEGLSAVHSPQPGFTGVTATLVTSPGFTWRTHCDWQLAGLPGGWHRCHSPVLAGSPLVGQNLELKGESQRSSFGHWQVTLTN